MAASPPPPDRARERVARGGDRLGWLRRVGAAATEAVAPSEIAALAVLGVGAVAVLVVLWFTGRGVGGPAPGPTAAPLVVASSRADVVVHVAGAVRAPGVFTLPAGARVGDALEAAGGALPAAALASLNLARVLADGEQVVVAVQGGPSPAGPSAAATASAPPLLPDGRLDLNRATAADLDTIPGIGPVLADRVIAARDAAGGFASVADLRTVPGIGERRFAELADLVGVAP
jgi:competence protein ComEA